MANSTMSRGITANMGTISGLTISGDLTVNGTADANVNLPAFKIHMDTSAGDQTISDSGWPATVIQMSEADLDTCSGHDNTAYTWTPNRAGVYFYSAQAYFKFNTAGSEEGLGKVIVYKNGTAGTRLQDAPILCHGATSEMDWVSNCTGLVDLNGSTDYLQFCAYFLSRTGGSDGAVVTNDFYTQASGFRIGPSTA